MIESPSSASMPRARILVVDDEHHIRAAIARALSLVGYQADEAGSGSEALALLAQAHYELMMVDLRMPEMDGVEVMSRARRLCPGLLIIVLTGHATLESAIAAVKSDAVDYLLKPASVHDIAAAVTRTLQEHAGQVRHRHLLHALSEAAEALRQSDVSPVPPPPPAADERFLSVGPLTLDRHKRLAVLAAEPPRSADLTEGEATLLAGLMEHPDQVLSCRELVCTVWGHEVEEWEAESLVRPCVSRLRRKLEANADHPEMIRTVRGRGYMLALVPGTPR